MILTVHKAYRIENTVSCIATWVTVYISAIHIIKNRVYFREIVLQKKTPQNNSVMLRRPSACVGPGSRLANHMVRATFHVFPIPHVFSSAGATARHISREGNRYFSERVIHERRSDPQPPPHLSLP